ncbi:ArnT family glycosyltransferase [Glycomyces mayteni]|uniref:ArnT family glycosyltransferase n=1 Tax=Glycomyces mayteni TaxID=543887 RepID=A0ABW2D5C0_9ACTN|nr:glycosyltransferase family 39 protein [Glycomyces mayteni]
MRPLHRLHPTLASLALAAALALTASRYDYHRDELYFLMLKPAWGYADQGPLTPLLGHLSIAALGNTVWAFRFPSILCMAGALWLAVLITRELGGGRAAQALCAWGLAFAGVALGFGHLLSTATVDLVVWVAVLLFVVRALMRDPRWWLAVGATAGIGLYNKHLIVLLFIGLAAGLLEVRSPNGLRSKWLWAGAALALVIGSPNLVYQALNGWPQLEMAAAIRETDGAENRVLLFPFQLLLLGVFLVPVWFAGLWALVRRPQWRPIRALAVAYPVMLVIVLVTGGQYYYPIGLVVAFYAVGCIPVAAWAKARGRRTLLVAGVALNGAVSAVVALPLLPVEAVGDSPVPAMNGSVADQVGWQSYARQVEAVVMSLPPEEAARTVVVTANYGEAGALDRYAAQAGPVYSGHNALFEYGPPPESATTVVTVGLPLERVGEFFDECTAVAVLDNHVGVDNEEQGETVGVCRGPVMAWSELWPEFQHYS